ncbi:nuclease [Endozoicomonas sp. (ex Bugula neritina AB1)]|nr:nuclease [Endozoicomonas sp. (ex Bugula neritina AB1)]
MFLKVIAISLIALSFASSAASPQTYGNIIVKEVRTIYDADTFYITVEGWPDIIGKRMPIRANGFDAPEIRGKCEKEKKLAQQAKQLTVQALRQANTIELRNMMRGKYFRIIADVYIDGKPLKEIHFDAGTARAYSGGKREGWCD